MYRALRRRAGRLLNAFPRLKTALRRIESALAGAPPSPVAPVDDPLPVSVRAPRVERVARDLERLRRRRPASPPGGAR